MSASHTRFPSNPLYRNSLYPYLHNPHHSTGLARPISNFSPPAGSATTMSGSSQKETRLLTPEKSDEEGGKTFEHVVELYPVITPTQNACVPSIKEKAYHLRECDSVVLGRGPSWAEKPKLDDGNLRCSVVSKEHAELKVIVGDVCIRDSNSTHGTRVNSELLSSNVWKILKDKDVITLGKNIVKAGQTNNALHFQVSINKRATLSFHSDLIPSTAPPLADLPRTYSSNSPSFTTAEPFLEFSEALFSSAVPQLQTRRSFTIQPDLRGRAASQTAASFSNQHGLTSSLVFVDDSGSEKSDGSYEEAEESVPAKESARLGSVSMSRSVEPADDVIEVNLIAHEDDSNALFDATLVESQEFPRDEHKPAATSPSLAPLKLGLAPLLLIDSPLRPPLTSHASSSAFVSSQRHPHPFSAPKPTGRYQPSSFGRRIAPARRLTDRDENESDEGPPEEETTIVLRRKKRENSVMRRKLNSVVAGLSYTNDIWDVDDDEEMDAEADDDGEVDAEDEIDYEDKLDDDHDFARSPSPSHFLSNSPSLGDPLSETDAQDCSMSRSQSLPNSSPPSPSVPIDHASSSNGGERASATVDRFSYFLDLDSPSRLGSLSPRSDGDPESNSSRSSSGDEEDRSEVDEEAEESVQVDIVVEKEKEGLAVVGKDEEGKKKLALAKEGKKALEEKMGEEGDKLMQAALKRWEEKIRSAPTKETSEGGSESQSIGEQEGGDGKGDNIGAVEERDGEDGIEEDADSTCSTIVVPFSNAFDEFDSLLDVPLTETTTLLTKDADTMQGTIVHLLKQEMEMSARGPSDADRVVPASPLGKRKRTIEIDEGDSASDSTDIASPLPSSSSSPAPLAILTTTKTITTTTNSNLPPTTSDAVDVLVAVNVTAEDLPPPRKRFRRFLPSASRVKDVMLGVAVGSVGTVALLASLGWEE